MASADLLETPGVVAPPMRMSAEDYLARERDPSRVSEPKSERLGGWVYEMPGVSLTHDRISANVRRVFDRQLDESAFHVSAGELKVGTSATDYTYPDLSVIPEPVETLDQIRDVATNPLVIVEVLSPSNSRHDRERKAKAYRKFESLTDILLISQDRPDVEHFHRVERRWVVDDIEPGMPLRLTGLPIELPFDVIYRGVELDV